MPGEVALRFETVGECRFCGAALSESVIDLGVTPLANAYLAPDADTAAEKCFPLHAYVCGGCYLVQLPEYESAEEIFGDYAYFSSYSQSWLDHARGYVDRMISRFGIGETSRVIEIASNDGYLLQYFQARGVPVLGIEPAANVAAAAEEKGVPTLVRFFGQRTARNLVEKGKMADLLVANNVLAHVPDLNDFVAGLRILLKRSGVLTIEVPHLLKLVEQTQFDTIYHEHFSYFSLTTVERVLNEHGLELFDVDELPTHGGSLRLYACREGASHFPSSSVARIKKAERLAGLDRITGYRDFAKRAAGVKRDLKDFLMGVRRVGKTVAGYGAPAKGNTLLNYCGIGPEYLPYTVDLSPHKQGRLLPGSHIPVEHPSVIAERRPDYVLILPWNLTDEIVRQMSEVRDWGGRFVVPIPEVKVLP